MEEAKITEVTEEKPQITIGMLSNIKNLVEVAIKRGAYQPSELSKVGTVYDQFSSVLDSLIQETKKD
jgi:hypothetical protein